jgi:hypothetical protein
MRNLSIIIWPLLGMLFMGEALAQDRAPIRQEDHFYRRKVVNRIDLNEKVNRPLIQRESAIYGDNGNIQKQGLVGALLMGLEQGRYVAYHPDDLSKPLTHSEVLARMQALDFAPSEDLEADWEEDGEDWIAPADDSEWLTEALPTDDLDERYGSAETDLDYGPYESVIQFVEDRVFDKNRGEMVYHYDYFQLIWSDPGETLPEKVLCVFRYEDISETLDEIVWINRHNDAERRSIKEIFDLRLFHSYIINVSGEGVRTLAEAEFRRQQLVNFEHHLWHY